MKRGLNDILIEKYSTNSGIGRVLLYRGDFKPVPAINSRNFWESLPDELRISIVEDGEKYLSFEWPILNASRYMDFVRNGDRGRYEKQYFERRVALGSLVVAECAEGKGRFIDDIINGIWCICEETSWVIPAHNNLQALDAFNALPETEAHFIDLFAAETGALLSWVHYLMKERMDVESELVCRRIRHEVKRRILDPYIAYDNFGWMGLDRPSGSHLNNWTPWCTSNCLTAALFMEEDGERRIRAVEKSMRSMDAFIASYNEDGGCDEGPNYWGAAAASLFDGLELLYSASNGMINIYDRPIIKDMGAFIYRVHISGSYFINFSDSHARVDIPAELVYRYGCRVADPKLSGLGLSSWRMQASKIQKGICYGIFRVLYAIINYKKLSTSTSEPPYERDIWLRDIQVMAARERAGTDEGLYLAAKGGNNGENHNHNDVGQYIVYSDGKPVVADLGVGTYTAKTFSDQRYEIWTMQSAFHNLPTINGIQQCAGSEFKASGVVYNACDSKVEFSMDIAPAYPAAADIEAWRRIYRFNREGKAYIEVIDDFRLGNAGGDIVLSLMTPCRHRIESPGLLVLYPEGGRAVSVEYDAASLSVASERIDIEDKSLSAMWGDCIYRILFQVKSKDTFLIRLVFARF